MSNAVRTGLKGAYNVFLIVGTMAALLTLAGLGPISRWVVPWVLITASSGVVAGFRARKAPVTAPQYTH
jgi:hypothetical protein